MTIVLIATLLYLTATGLLVRAVVRDDAVTSPAWLWPVLPAMLLHGGYHVLVAMRTSGGPDMHFFAALSLVGLGMAWLTSLVAARGRMAALGVLVFPMAAVVLWIYHAYGHEAEQAAGLAVGHARVDGAARLRHPERGRVAGDHAVAAGTRPAPP